MPAGNLPTHAPGGRFTCNGDFPFQAGVKRPG